MWPNRIARLSLLILVCLLLLTPREGTLSRGQSAPASKGEGPPPAVEAEPKREGPALGAHEGAGKTESRAPAHSIADSKTPPIADSKTPPSEVLPLLEGERLDFASAVFDAKCALCHQSDGKGAGDPRMNLVDEVWNHGGALADVERTIREGVPETLMQPQKGSYTPQQIADLAKYVKLLAHRMHAASDEAERDAATELTNRLAARLPRAPTVAVGEEQNFIDRYIFGKMKADGVPHAGLSSDAEFMRRVYLDLWGRLPDTDPGNPVTIIDQNVEFPNRYTVQQFVADPDPNKRIKLIDHLLGLDYMELPFATGPDYKGPWLVQRPFVSKWTYFFADLFRDGSPLFRDYLYNIVKYNIPYDYFVRDMLTATALFKSASGPAGFLLRHQVDGLRCADVMHEDTLDEIAVHTTKLFLGVNLQCVSCHDGANHLDTINLWLAKRKRVEFWRQAAFFGNLHIIRPGLVDNNYTLVDGYSPRPERIWQGGIAYFKFSSKPTANGGLGYRMEAPSVLRMPRDRNAKVYPEYLLTKERPAPNANPRTEFARMLTSDFQFAKVTVNLFWSKFMTVGIVDPPLDWDLDRQDPDNPPPAPWTIQPSHPELLDALARDFQNSNFDLRHLMRTIVSSKAYQLSSRFDGQYKPEYDRYYARKLVRRLSAEEIYDALAKATDVFGHDIKYVMDEGGPPGDKELRRFLDFFGQSNRITRQASTKGSVVQASMMMNSDVVKRKALASTEGSRVSELLSKTPALPNEKIVEELFLATLSRYPTEQEMATGVSHVAMHRDKGVEDLQWALLNKLEFMVNY